MFRIFGARRKLLGAVALAMSLLAMPAMSGHAWASFAGCGTDPTVTLSNGTVVTLSANIGTDISNVQQVSYVLHVPHNLTISNISYDQYGYLESVQLAQDQIGNNFVTETTVQTSLPAVPVTAYTTLSGKQVTQSITGVSGQDLVLSFSSSQA